MAASIVFGLAGCGSRQGGQQASKSGKPAAEAAAADAPTTAPEFALESTTGQTVRLSELKGKVVLVDFWATWCGPCRASIPHLADVYNRYKDKGVEVVGIADDTNEKSSVAPFVQREGIPYTVVYGDGKVGGDFGGIVGYPTLFIVNREGQVVRKIIGYVDEQTLEAAVTPLL